MGNLGAQKEKRNDTPISAKKDKFQDYDFAFFVSDIECFTHEESWLSLFGECYSFQPLHARFHACSSTFQSRTTHYYANL